MRALRKNIFRGIFRSPGRFLAILGIIVLGSGFFVGLRISQQAMINTADQYLTEQAFYDFSISTTLGLTDDDVAAFAEAEGVAAAEGSVSADALVLMSEEAEAVVCFYSMPQTINLPALVDGRMPENDGECLVDAHSGFAVGDVLTLTDSNETDTLDMFKHRSFTVVGTATSPLYLNYERGNTSLGTGTISAFAYILPEAFDVDYYTTVYLRMADMPSSYSSAYDDAIDQWEDSITELAEERAEIRYDDLLSEANDKLAEGESEYVDGLAEYESERADAEAELNDAWAQLEDARVQIQDGQTEIDNGWNELYTQAADGRAELDQAETELNDALTQLQDGEAEYESGMADYQDGLAQYNEKYAEYEDGLAQYNAGAAQYNAGAAQLEEAKNQLDTQQAGFDTLTGTLASAIVDPSTHEPLYADSSALLEALGSGDQMAQTAVNTALGAMPEMPGMPTNSDELLAAEEVLNEGWNEYNAGKAQLDQGGASLGAAWIQISDGKAQLDEAWAELEDARIQLEEARSELDQGWEEYNTGVQELTDGREELENAISEGTLELQNAEAELADAQAEYDDGLAEYEDGRAEADAEFADAEAELADARSELADARSELADIRRPSTYVLGRWSNVGYACFENDTSIVKSISTVFPLFFFLVAALICVTTITRMVDEQRSQLGVFMALGYGRLAIMSKFLIYSGSATVLGCVIGITLGSWVIPRVVWAAYTIMYNFSDSILFYFGTGLSALVFTAYLAAMLLVTWLACRRELRDTPANIIRPKAPKAGKRIVLERIPFLWKHLSFMWKVTLRNIFRYKQRVLMMILGIAGCTALMIAGLGIRDSIQNVVDFQFSEITHYDFTVTFDEPVDEAGETAFAQDAATYADGVLFVRQSSVTAISGKTEKTAYLTVVDDETELSRFVDLHADGTPLPWPGEGQALINSGLAEALDLEAGDSISIRSDSEEDMTFTISGIFDNYIYNYIYISPETYQAQSGAAPEINTVMILTAEGDSESAVITHLLGLDNVLNVTASTTMRERIDSMMNSLIYIVLLTIICAAALAFIVIYNLTNINITERLREIATVKVLGFYQWESAIYVLRENILLTIVGAGIGIPLGIWLNSFIIGQVKVDMVSFTPRVEPLSFVLALLLTFVFSALVDLFMYFHLSRINTAEALKAAE